MGRGGLSKVSKVIPISALFVYFLVQCHYDYVGIIRYNVTIKKRSNYGKLYIVR